MNKLKYLILVLLLITIASAGFWFVKNGNSSKSVITKNEIKAKNSIENKPAEIEKKEIKILFLGDMMLDRYIREVAMKKGNDYILEKVRDSLTDNDLVIANLEGPITDKESVSRGTEIGAKGHLSFTFHPGWAKTLSDNNIKLVNLGNNHILNFGLGGVESTEKYLAEAGVNYFCSPDKQDKRYIIKELNGLKIGFVGYNQFEENAENKTLTDIAQAKKQSDLVVIYTHWGKEYDTTILPSNRILGRKFIDAGADLVIGSHPHVVEPSEEYQGKKIFYSLGNFIFDQYFSEETQNGLAVKVIIDPADKSIEFQEIKLKLKNNGQTEKDSSE